MNYLINVIVNCYNKEKLINWVLKTDLNLGLKKMINYYKRKNG